jgi:hypothetical protein
MRIEVADINDWRPIDALANWHGKSEVKREVRPELHQAIGAQPVSQEAALTDESKKERVDMRPHIGHDSLEAA